MKFRNYFLLGIFYLLSLFWGTSCNHTPIESEYSADREAKADEKQLPDISPEEEELYCGSWKLVAMKPDFEQGSPMQKNVRCKMEKSIDTRGILIFHLFTHSTVLFHPSGTHQLISDNGNVTARYDMRDSSLIMQIKGGSEWVFKRVPTGNREE